MPRFDPLTGCSYREPLVASGDLMTDHRARIALAESERHERKQHELRELVSERNTPAERIRIWERRHGLTLPRDSSHRVLCIVAAATDLPLDRVREEQQRRSAAAKAEPLVAPTSG